MNPASDWMRALPILSAWLQAAQAGAGITCVGSHQLKESMAPFAGQGLHVHVLMTGLTHAKSWRLRSLTLVCAAGVDVATDPRAPRIAKIVQPEDIREKTGVTSPHCDALHRNRVLRRTHHLHAASSVCFWPLEQCEEQTHGTMHMQA